MDLSGFNEQQKKAILLPISPEAAPEILILAGAGSGKTRVLTHRVAYLISNGVPANRILAMTFTKKAAKEMLERTQQLVGFDKKVTMSTFHSLCADLLRRFSTEPFDIIDDHDQKAILKTHIKETPIFEDVALKEYLQWLSFVRSKCIDPIKPGKEDSDQIKLYRYLTQKYIDSKKRLGAYDFDDLLEKTVSLLSARPDITDLIHLQWPYILVDEYQDTNRRQAELLQLMRGPRTQFLQVGDEDQLIYSWRGAEIGHILSSYERSLIDKNVICISLLTNYRCSANILQLANSVVSVNHKRTGKTLSPHLPKGAPVDIEIYPNEYEEASAIARRISKWYSQGIPLNDMAVLVRVNMLSKPLERALIDKKLPYHLHNGTALFDRIEVRLMLNMLWFSSKPDETFYLQQILDVYKTGVGPGSLKKMVSELTESNDWLKILKPLATKKPKIASLIASCEKAKALMEAGNLADAADHILHHSAMLDSFKEEEREARAENILLVSSVIRDYEDEAKANGETISLSGFQEQRLLNDTLTDKSDQKSVVHIMSIHKAKGLEFTCGAILGVQDGVFPMGFNDGQNDDEEDVRLAYVAFTRFKKELLVTRAARRARFNDISLASSLTGPHETELKKLGVIKVDFK